MPLLEAHHVTLAEKVRKAAAGLPASEVSGEDLAVAVAGLGLYPHLIPSAYGGVAERVDVRGVCIIREAIAYRSPAADSVYAVQGLGSHPVLLGGNDAQRQALLTQVAKGTALFAFALTEPDAGSDAGALATSAKVDGDHYVLQGHKRFISNAGIATHYTVFARTSADRRGISAFVVPADAPGLRVDTSMKLMADHPIGELFLKDCRIPRSALLGKEGDGMRLALGTLDIFRSTVGAAAVGMAQRALDEALDYVRKRKQFGSPLASLQGVQFLLADSAVELEASRLLVHRAAAEKDEGQERVTYPAAVAKLFATEAAQRIIDRCLQLHGGNGVVKGFAVEHLYRDIRSLRIYEGASEVQKVVIARHLLGSE